MRIHECLSSAQGVHGASMSTLLWGMGLGLGQGPGD